ncbi:MAG: B12-binding domain-containing radical SAM protein [Bacteroidetes bacterium]|nr:B12-binding domain-containing radical SAM protein [Bacteroidota bacterium]
MAGKDVILFNPRSNHYKPRLPNSILQVAASIEGTRDYVIVDGNLEADPWQKIQSYLKEGRFGYFGCTVMPGPQLQQAIPFTINIKKLFPEIKIIWGGYFASNQYKSAIKSDAVDFIVNGPGDKAFPLLLDAIESGGDPGLVPNLIIKKEGKIVFTRKDEIYDQDTLPSFNYEKLNTFYPVESYLGNTYLGKKTIAYHSSFGCPFTCSFCAVVPIYNARWKGKSAELIYKDIRLLKDRFGGDAIEFHDNNFFVSEKRTVEFAKLIKPDNISWWGEGRIDTLNKYSDESLQLMKDSGCKMIFFGAETGNDAVLKEMDKGGTQTGAQILEFAARLRKSGIIPEYSFVLGTPAATEKEVYERIKGDIAFIRKVKEVNPDTEIIIYVYSPVPTEGSEMYEQVKKAGFKFPEKLEEWLDPAWANFDLRKNPLTPWLKPYMIDLIMNFETVLNGYYPTVSDFKMSEFQRKFMKFFSTTRYHAGIYSLPYEIKALQKFWLRYRQPEWEGF